MQKFLCDNRASSCDYRGDLGSSGLCESGWGVDIDLGGWEGNIGVLDLGELGALHVLLQAREVAHALVEVLQVTVSFPGLSSSNMVCEVEVLEENKIGDDWLSTSQELPSVFEEITELREAFEAILNDCISGVLFEAHHSIVDYGFIADTLQLVCSSLLLWSSAKCRWQVLSSDVLVNGKSLGELDIAINNVGQVAEGHELRLILAPVWASPHVGSFFPVCTAMSEHEACNIAAAATAQVQVSENNFIFAACLSCRSGSCASS